MAIQEYEPKRTPVRAVIYTGDNADEILEVLGKRGRLAIQWFPSDLGNPDDEHDRYSWAVLDKGEYVGFSEYGRLEVWDKRQFESEYNPIGD